MYKNYIFQKKNNSKHGIGLIEIVIGVAVLTVSLFAISSFYARSLGVSQKTTHLVQASFLLEEGLEVARLLRDESWQNIASLTSGTEYYLTFSGSNWATSTTSTLVDNLFERVIIVQDVNRDLSDDIVSSGGILDPNTKQVTVSVSWQEDGETTTHSISTYLTNFFAS